MEKENTKQLKKEDTFFFFKCESCVQALALKLVYISSLPLGTKNGQGLAEAEVTGGCELTTVGAGNKPGSSARGSVCS